MNYFITLLLASSACLVHLSAAQCTGDDHPSCSGWIKDGFCSSTTYTQEYIKKFCGVACGLCNADGTQTAAGGGSSLTACSDSNPNCATWLANGFCTDPTYSNSLKLLYCCASCRPSLIGGSSTTVTGSTVSGSSSTTSATTTIVGGK